MLILTRKAGESIRIDKHILITVLEVEGRNLKLGIEAPKDIPIYREEVYLRTLEENRDAAKSDGKGLDGIAKLLKKGDGRAAE